MRRLCSIWAGIGAALLALSQPAQGQDAPKMPRIGILSPVDETSALISGFREGMKELGYVDGRNVRLEYRWRTCNWTGCLVLRRISSPSTST